jgi:hypothetical protein
MLLYLRFEEILLVCRDKQWHYFDESDDTDESCPITRPLNEVDDETEEEI